MLLGAPAGHPHVGVVEGAHPLLDRHVQRCEAEEQAALVRRDKPALIKVKFKAADASADAHGLVNAYPRANRPSRVSCAGELRG